MMTIQTTALIWQNEQEFHDDFSNYITDWCIT